MTTLDKLRAQLAAVDRAVEALTAAHKLAHDDRLKWLVSDVQRARAYLLARLEAAELEVMRQQTEKHRCPGCGCPSRTPVCDQCRNDRCG